jgi:hypothetical protein
LRQKSEQDASPVVERLRLLRKPTGEENRQWQEILKKLESTEPHFPTLEEAMQLRRIVHVEPKG